MLAVHSSSHPQEEQLKIGGEKEIPNPEAPHNFLPLYFKTIDADCNF